MAYYLSSSSRREKMLRTSKRWRNRGHFLWRHRSCLRTPSKEGNKQLQVIVLKDWWYEIICSTLLQIYDISWCIEVIIYLASGCCGSRLVCWYLCKAPDLLPVPAAELLIIARVSLLKSFVKWWSVRTFFLLVVYFPRRLRYHCCCCMNQSNI